MFLLLASFCIHLSLLQTPHPKASPGSHDLSSSMARPVIEGLSQETEVYTCASFGVHKLSSCFSFVIYVWFIFNLQKTHTTSPPKASPGSHDLSSSMARLVIEAEGLSQETEVYTCASFGVHKLSSCFSFVIYVWFIFNLQKTHTTSPPKASPGSHDLSSSMARPVIEGLSQEPETRKRRRTNRLKDNLSTYFNPTARKRARNAPPKYN